MSSTGSVMDLVLFYETECLLYNIMVGRMAKFPKLAKPVIAFWIFMEEIGYYNLIKTISSCPSEIIESVFGEALSCLECLLPQATIPTSTDDTPVLAGLLSEPIDRRFFFYNRNFVFSRILHIMNTVCNVIFEDPVMNNPVLGQTRQGSTTQGIGSNAAWNSISMASTELGESSSRASHAIMRSLLNPQPILVSQDEMDLEENRSMFLTFSNGYPLHREEIFEFFITNWGPVVEDVYIERTPLGVAPKYGRVIFKSPSVMYRILDGNPRAKFVVNRKHLWARVYIPHHRNQQQT